MNRYFVVDTVMRSSSRLDAKVRYFQVYLNVSNFEAIIGFIHLLFICRKQRDLLSTLWKIQHREDLAGRHLTLSSLSKTLVHSPPYYSSYPTLELNDQLTNHQP